jgi:hypothetical protein
MGDLQEEEDDDDDEFASIRSKSLFLVYCVLPKAIWLAWDQQFRSAAADLPVRVLE